MSNHHGDFIWYELMTADSAAARSFYGPMLGWRFGGNEAYREIQASEGSVGGILQLTPEMIAEGAHPCWLGYLLVDDVDRTVASIAQDGGRTLMPARDMDGVGRFAMVTDPQGAPFYLIRPTPPAEDPGKISLAFSYDGPRLGHCAWNELRSSDPDSALSFYGRHFGWVKNGEMDMGPVGKYQFLRHAGRAPEGSPPGHGMLGAVMPKPPGAPGPSAWAHYFRVSDIDAAVRHIVSSGATVVTAPTEIPGGDFSMNAIDPQGAHFALVGSRKG